MFYSLPGAVTKEGVGEGTRALSTPVVPDQPSDSRVRFQAFCKIYQTHKLGPPGIDLLRKLLSLSGKRGGGDNRFTKQLEKQVPGGPGEGGSLAQLILVGAETTRPFMSQEAWFAEAH